MTYIIHVRYGARSDEIKNATEIYVDPVKPLEKLLDFLREKYEKHLDVPFPIVDFWKITKW